MPPEHLHQQPANQHSQSPFRHLSWVLLFGSCVLYLITLGHQFTLDDAIVLTENRFVTSGDFWSVLSTDSFAGFFNHEHSSQLVEGGRYRPLSLLLFTMMWQVTQSPWVYHALNVLVYALTVVMVYQLVLRLHHPSVASQKQPLLALLTALFFAVHPIHTEVVNNIKGLDDLLSLLLGLAAWRLILSKSANFNVYLTAFVLMLLAMLSKESAIVLLPLIALSLWFFQQVTVSQACKRVIPLILGVGTYLLIRALVIAPDVPVMLAPEPMNDPFLEWQDGQWVSVSLADRLGTVLLALGLYLGKVILPLQLSHDHYPQSIPLTGIMEWPALLSLLIHLALLIYALVGIYNRRFPAFAITVYGVSLALFANLFFTIGTLLAERFLYIPSLGACWLLAWLLVRSLTQNRTSGGRLLVLKLAVTSLLVLASAFTVQRSLDWHDNLTLFEADIGKSAESAKLNNALGGELTSRSQQPPVKATTQESEYLHRALGYLDKAIGLHPTYAMPHLSKGNALHYLGHNQAAIQSYATAIRLKPGYPEAIENLGKVKAIMAINVEQQALEQLEQQAIAYSEHGQFNEAIVLFDQLIARRNSAKYHFFRGVAHGQSAAYEQALQDFKVAEQMTAADDHNNLLRIWQALLTTHQQLGHSEQVTEYQDKIDHHLSQN
jgi:tetratricopeptide (TPR) repeat protein